MTRIASLWLLPVAVLLLLPGEDAAAQPFLTLRLPFNPSYKPPALLGAPLLKPEPGDDELRKLLKERYNAALREMKAHYTRIGAPFVCNPPWEAMRDAAFRALETRLELSDKPEDHVRVRQEQFEWEREDERTTALGHAVGRFSDTDLVQAKHRRLDAEIKLLQAKQRTGVAPPKKQVPLDDEFHKLLKERYDAAVAEWKALQAEFLLGRKSQDVLVTARFRLVHAELELSNKPDDHLRVRQEQVAWAKENESVIQQRYDAGRTDEAELQYARYIRLDAEIKLLLAKKASAGKPK